jgi:hypothetical protein
MSNEGTAHMNPQASDTDLSPVPESLQPTDRPDGPGAAMMVSAGLAILVLGFLTVLAEASAGAKTWLQSWDFGLGAGPLAGKTTIAALAYVGSLALLWALWRNKDVNLRNAFYISAALAILGALGTFPPLFQLFTV